MNAEEQIVKIRKSLLILTGLLSTLSFGSETPVQKKTTQDVEQFEFIDIDKLEEGVQILSATRTSRPKSISTPTPKPTGTKRA